MSTPSGDQREKTPSDAASRDLIFYCTVCFASLAGSPTGDGDPPYWLTSCGHIVCSEHIFPNGVPAEATKQTHTCPHCERTEISLAGVQGGQLPPEGLRDYFTPQSELLENFSGALRFQYENAVRAANHYKRLAEKLHLKLENQKSVLLKVRDELLEARELRKRDVERAAELTRLREENDQLRKQPGASPKGQSQAQPGKNTQLEISPIANAQKDGGLKRKADPGHEDVDRVRDFRRELNGRSTMPPPPQPVQTRPPQTPSMPPPPVPPPKNDLPRLHHLPPSHQLQTQLQQQAHFQAPPEPTKIQRFQTPSPAFQLTNTYTDPPASSQFFNNTVSENYPYNAVGNNYTGNLHTSSLLNNQQQTFNNLLPSTPRGPAQQATFFNPPYRSPIYPPPSFSSNSISQSNPYNSPTTPQPPLQNVISPTGNGVGRFSLLPQNSHGRAFNTSAPPQVRPQSASSPYFQGLGGVGGVFGGGTAAGVGGRGAGGRDSGGTQPVFGAQFLGARQTSSIPQSRGGGVTAGSGGVGGGLNAVLQLGSENTDRPGLMRVVRRGL